MQAVTNVRWIYRFSNSLVDSVKDSRAKLGGKGAALAEMSRLGIPVPPGFTISAEICSSSAAESELPESLRGELEEAVKWLEAHTGKPFGATQGMPLLVSVRSGAAVSMPGMMDTILNLGLNATTVKLLAKLTGNACFAYDSYARFLHMYGKIVMGIDPSEFELAHVPKPSAGAGPIAEQLKASAYEGVLHRHGGFPQDPWEQLLAAITAVFRSWQSPRAQLYRKLNGISEELGTAVNVQTMVFGNLGERSGTGVAFTRCPNTGENKLYGEWLPRAQGEDVVAGMRTPHPLSDGPESLRAVMPASFAKLERLRDQLENHFADMQDIEFTVEHDELYVLQTRSAKRTAQAGVRVAVDLVKEGRLSRDAALKRVDARSLVDLLFPRLDRSQEHHAIARGLPASPGAVTGVIALSNQEALDYASQGLDVILVREETSPDDLEGIAVSKGVLTSRGGATSHAAVVARSMGKSCVVGCQSMDLNMEKSRVNFQNENVTLHTGMLLSLDGTAGEVFQGKVATLPGALSPHVEQLLAWADEVRSMGVRANADTPEQAERALHFGARGIGLCRTEHMFFGPERLPWMQRLILADTEQQRAQALQKLEAFQRSDFTELFRTMAGHPVTIRLLDPPLHEFLPTTEAQIQSLANARKMPVFDLKRRAEALREANPMLGHRGVRLSVSYPEIVRAQVTAIMGAACAVAKEGLAVHPEIKVPLVMSTEEMKRLKAQIEAAAEAVIERSQQPVHYEIGAMIELPRAALLADKIAEFAEFYSFGTNDLTQTTLGLSRDDSTRFMSEYQAQGLMPADPFVTIDREGVGQLMRIACRRARKVRRDMSIGVCGEHGGDPNSIEFCQELGLDYVSCSPFRVPVARLACAQARLRQLERKRHDCDEVPPSLRSA